MTIKLLIVGEGENERTCVPGLVAGFVRRPVVEHEFAAWPRLHRGGFGRKLVFAIRQAIDRQLQGVAATVDSDSDQHRKLAGLIAARDDARLDVRYVPTAVGEAIPHLEAWLLDDPVAVRLGLGLATSAAVPAPTKTKSPKEALDELYEQSGCQQTRGGALSSISGQVDQARCNHASQTGWAAFVSDMQSELGRLFGP